MTSRKAPREPLIVAPTFHEFNRRSQLRASCLRAYFLSINCRKRHFAWGLQKAQLADCVVRAASRAALPRIARQKEAAKMRLLVWAAAAVCVRALQVDDAPPFGDLSPEAQLRELRATLSDEDRALMEAALEGAKAMGDELFGPPPRRTAAATQAIQLDFSKDDPLPPTQQKYLDEAIIDSRIHFARAINYKDLEFHIDHQGYRPLHLAAQQGEAGAVRELLRLGADANARLLPTAPAGPATVLHIAAQWGRVDIVRQLVRDGGAKIDVSSEGMTPLERALTQDHSNTARALIDLGADLSLVSGTGWTPLACAANHGNVKLVKKLIKAGADPSQRMTGGWTALHLLTHHDLPVAEWSAACLVALYQGGADLDARDDEGRTLLYIAASHGSAAFFKFLIWLGADVTIGNNDGVLPAEVAEENGHVFTVGEINFRYVYLRLKAEGHDGLTAITLTDSFLDRGANIEETGENKVTALTHACVEDRRDLIGWFVSRGADKRLAEGCEPHLDLIGRVEKIVAEGRFSRERLDAAFESLFMHPFPLNHIGEFGDQAPLVEPLVALGYDVNALSDQHGAHPLHIPALYGRTELVRALIRAGADPDVRLSGGHAALYYAAGAGHEDIVRLLLDAGADVRAPLEGGRSIFDLAKMKGHTRVAELLARHDRIKKRRTTLLVTFGVVLVGVLSVAYLFVSKPAAERAARELERELELEAEREAAARAPASKRDDRSGVRRRAHRGRRRDATRARDPAPDVQEPALESTAPEPEAAVREQERLDREAAAEAAEVARSREAAAARAREDEKRELEAAAAREQEARDREAAAEAARLALDREAAAAREREAWEREKLDSLQAMATWATASEGKTEESLGREESKEEPVPEGYEIIARILEHLGEPHLLPIFEAEDINDKTLPDLDPADLIGLGVSQMTCLTILGAAHSAAKTKKLEAEEVLDNVAKHQSVLEEELREHRAEIKRLRIRELPEDLMCPIMCEIMKDPVLLMEDGHTYERVALEQWFATGARTSPSTSAELDSLATAPNHTVKKLIAALLEEHRGRAAD